MTEIWQVINGGGGNHFCYILKFHLKMQKKKKKKDRKSVFILILLGEKNHYKI